MRNNTIVQWHDTYSIGVKLVDEQHKKLIALTNELYINCMASNRRSSDAFLKAMHEVIDYTDYHFATEEKIMERVKYPDLIYHKKEHIYFTRDVLMKVKGFSQGKVTSSNSFTYFLRDWVLHHIAVNDKKLGEHLIQLKKSGELQKMNLIVRRDPAQNRVYIR